jgi:hypothetical protein
MRKYMKVGGLSQDNIKVFGFQKPAKSVKKNGKN